MAGKQAPLVIRQEEGIDYIRGEDVDAKVETSDAARAAWDLARLDTPGGALWDGVKAAVLDAEGEQVSPEELNKRYGLEDTFQVPLTEDAAAIIAERAVRRKQSEEVMSRAEQGMINSTVAFGTSVAANMIDPLNLAADIAVGKGLGILAKSGKIAMMTSWGAKGASAGRRFGEAAVEGALGNLAVEPLVFGARSIENKTRGLDEVAMETIAGALAFPAVKFVGGEFLSRGAKFWNGLDTRSASSIYRSAKAQIMQGRKIDIEPLTREQVLMTSDFEVPDGKALMGSKTAYDYVPKSAPAAGDKFYVSVLNDVDDISKAKFGQFADDYGAVVNATDNAFAANGASARLTSDRVGNVIEVEVDPSAKVIDLEQRFVDADEKVSSTIRRAYEEATGREFKFKEDVTLKDIYEEMYEGVLNDKYKADLIDNFNKVVRESGYDGYRHDGSRLAGMEHNPHNVLAVFNPDKLRVTGQAKADRAFVRRLSMEERVDIMKKSLSDDEPGFWEDTKTAKQMEQELRDGGIDPDRPVDFDDFRELDPERIDEEAEIALRDERITEDQYKSLKEMSKLKKDVQDMETRLFECMTGEASNV